LCRPLRCTGTLGTLSPHDLLPFEYRGREAGDVGLAHHISNSHLQIAGVRYPAALSSGLRMMQADVKETSRNVSGGSPEKKSFLRLTWPSKLHDYLLIELRQASGIENLCPDCRPYRNNSETMPTGFSGSDNPHASHRLRCSNTSVLSGKSGMQAHRRTASECLWWTAWPHARASFRESIAVPKSTQREALPFFVLRFENLRRRIVNLARPCATRWSRDDRNCYKSDLPCT
jgi:hypothetical protein